MATIEWRDSKRGRYAYLNSTVNGRRSRISLGLISEGEACERLARFKLDQRNYTPPRNADVMAKCLRHLPEMFASCRKNAKRRGIKFEITEDDLREALEIVGPCCTLTGIQFSWDPYPGALKRPWVPSIDRIESLYGYVPGNIRFVCAMANFAMNQWGEAALCKLATAMVSYYGPYAEPATIPTKLSVE